MLFVSDQDFNNAARIVNLPNPVAAQQAATKAYVNSAIEGLAPKDSVRVRTTANINLASPGAALDGITMAVNDRFLADGQTTGAEKGLYIWNGAAVAATRAADGSTFDELEQAIVSVEEGTSAGVTYRQTIVNGVIGTTTPVFVVFGNGSSAASETTAGVAEIATQAETDAGTDDARFVTPLKLATLASRFRRMAQTFGDGSATQYDITHNFNTLDVHVAIVRVSDGATVIADVTRLNVNTVRINTAAAVASNALRALVHN